MYSTYHIFKVIGPNIPEIKIFTGGWRNGPAVYAIRWWWWCYEKATKNVLHSLTMYAVIITQYPLLTYIDLYSYL